ASPDNSGLFLSPSEVAAGRMMNTKRAGMYAALLLVAMTLGLSHSAYAVLCRIEFPAEPSNPGVTYYYENEFSILDNRLVPKGEASITASVRPARTVDNPAWVEKRAEIEGGRRPPSYKVPSLRLEYLSGTELNDILA